MNIIIRNHFEEYEVVGAGRQSSSSSSERCKPTCHAMARQFISQFSMEYSDWSGVLMRLGICRPVNFYHKDDVWNEVASLYQQGRLEIYKLRRFDSFKAVPIGNGVGICFIKGPKPHQHTIYAVLAINNTQDAMELVANLPSDNSQLLNCLAANDLAKEFKNVGDIRKALIEKLVNKTILAYSVPVKTMAPPQKQEELVPATGPGYDKVPLAPESKPSTPAPVERKTDPQSLNEAAQRLKDASPAEVPVKAADNPTPKSSYTIADKQAANSLNLTYPVQTEANEAFFWSGKTNGIGGESVARQIAQQNQGTTLEALIENRGIQMPVWDSTNPDVVQAWKAISADYAAGSSGTVRAVIGQNLRSGNVWETAELPSLIKNPNVDRIVTVDPVTKVETEIFVRSKK